jgi:hypothetical protein
MRVLGFIHRAIVSCTASLSAPPIDATKSVPRIVAPSFVSRWCGNMRPVCQRDDMLDKGEDPVFAKYWTPRKDKQPLFNFPKILPSTQFLRDADVQKYFLVVWKDKQILFNTVFNRSNLVYLSWTPSSCAVDV